MNHVFIQERSFYPRVLKIALPIAFQGLITVGVNIMDTMMLGRLNEVQISGSSLANEYIFLFQIACLGLGGGASVLTSRFWGMKDLHQVRKAITLMLRVMLTIATAVMVFSALCPGMILRLYTPDAQVIEKGTAYLRWSLPTYYLMGFTLTCTQMLRSVGQVHIPLIAAIVAFAGNVFFNWMFIFGKLGAPRMEIAGAALGTVLARVLECSLVCGYMFFRDDRIRYRFKHLFMPCGDLVREYVRISVPVLCSDMLLALGNSAIAIVIGHLGSAYVAAQAISKMTLHLSTVMNQGLSQAASIITGHTIGAGKRELAQKQGYGFWSLGIMVGLFASLLVMLIRDPLISFYNVSETTRAIAQGMMTAVSVVVLFSTTDSMLTKGVLRGGGDTRFLLVADVLFLWILSVPLGYMAGFHWGLPPFWIYLCLKSDQVVKAILCIFRLRSKRWIKDVHSPNTANSATDKSE